MAARGLPADGPPVRRRDVLQVGALGVCGLGLPDLLRARAEGAASSVGARSST